MCTKEIFKQLQNFRQQTEWLRKNSPYYPLTLLLVVNGETIMSTIVRKEHEDKWYKWLIVKRSVQEIDSSADLLNRIMVEAYNVLLLGQVNLKITDIEGFPMYELDTNQDSEIERLIKIRLDEIKK